MTGFGGARAKGEGFVVSVDLRTVNHRYFKLQSRFPEELASLAGPAEAEIRKALRRGSVFITVRLDLLDEGPPALVNERLLRTYAELCRTLAAKYKTRETAPAATDLLALPGVLKTPEEGLRQNMGTIEPVFRAALKQALAALDVMRAKEGKALQRELTNRLRAARRALVPIEKGLPAALAELEQKLFERVEALIAKRGVALERADLAREVAILTERTDVTEEVERLRSHLDQAEGLVAAGGEIGRQLDFLAQEMLRETTTTAAKVGSCGLAERVLGLKVEIDRLKEQVQNIE
jgi:uncharacterized protein (TIGR00255 family)